MAASDARPVGIGCMRLSTAAGRDDDRAVAVVHAALDAGVTFFDTADSYCSNESDVGHNERLIARALATWAGDRSRVIVATKGGLTRPDGQWVPDGRAKHLAAACEASCRALGVDRISLYQLHAPDPRVPFATSVRALDALKRDGRIEAIGLCNVNLRQLQEACEITEISAVQVELNPWQDVNILSGVAGYCVLNGIRLVAYRPLGGPRRRRAIASDPLLSAIAVSHHATPHEVVLTWLAGLGEGLIPIPGPSRVETAASVGYAATIVLTDSERAQLDAHFPACARLRRAKTPALVTAGAAERDGEVVLVMGLPAAGKSTIARRFAERGYTRLNRDEIGGSLRAMVPALEREIVAGATRLVLDNTYISRTSRAPIIEVATRWGLQTRGVWVATPVEDAQTNACWRMIEKYGRLLEPDEIRQTARRDPSIFGPGVHFRYERELEMPGPSEGFAAFEVVPFSRVLPPEFTERAVIVWCDGVLRRSRTGQRTPSSADDVEVQPGCGDRLREYQREGWRVIGLSWQPEISDGTMSRSEVAAAFDRTRELLNLDLEVHFCPHPAGPPICWCRKPLPGLGVVVTERHRLDPTKCLYVGASSQDPGFARRLGFEFRPAEQFFGAPFVTRL